MADWHITLKIAIKGEGPGNGPKDPVAIAAQVAAFIETEGLSWPGRVYSATQAEDQYVVEVTSLNYVLHYSPGEFERMLQERNGG